VTRPIAVLVGPPGAGKTTVGRRLAARLGVAFRDTDADVERAAGKPVSDIFVEDGEAAFRALERRAVVVALAEHDGVLSLGGGAVLGEETRRALAGHEVVFLSADLSAAARRVGLGQGRPLVGLNPRAQLRMLLDQRLPLYREAAVHTVETSGRDVEQVVDAVLRALPDRATATARPASARDRERHRQAEALALAVATASALPQRPPGPLLYPSFRSLAER
jgi:shikimate kinase